MTNKANYEQTLQPLVVDGTLSMSQRDAVVQRLVASSPTQSSKSLKALVSEAIVYLGGAIIFGSGALLIAQTWDDLGNWGRPGVLVLAATALWIAGALIKRKKQDDEGRRLTSTLLSGGAGLIGFAANNVLTELWVPKMADGLQDWINTPLWVDPAQVAISLSCVFLFAAIGYRIANSALALVVTGGTVLGVSIATGQLINYLLGPDTRRDQVFDSPYPWLAGAILGVASSLWLWMWSRNLFKEKVIAHIIGLFGIFLAFNTLREGYSEDVVAALLILVGLCGLWFYVKTHLWPYLVFGLGSLLVGGIQLLFTYVEGVGGALASMAFGAVLVVVGIRLVKDKPETVH